MCLQIGYTRITENLHCLMLVCAEGGGLSPAETHGTLSPGRLVLDQHGRVFTSVVADTRVLPCRNTPCDFSNLRIYIHIDEV